MRRGLKPKIENFEKIFTPFPAITYVNHTRTEHPYFQHICAGSAHLWRHLVVPFSPRPCGGAFQTFEFLVIRICPSTSLGMVSSSALSSLPKGMSNRFEFRIFDTCLTTVKIRISVRCRSSIIRRPSSVRVSHQADRYNRNSLLARTALCPAGPFLSPAAIWLRISPHTPDAGQIRRR